MSEQAPIGDLGAHTLSRRFFNKLGGMVAGQLIVPKPMRALLSVGGSAAPSGEQFMGGLSILNRIIARVVDSKIFDVIDKIDYLKYDGPALLNEGRKLYEILALGKQITAEDCSAVRELTQDRTHSFLSAVQLVTETQATLRATSQKVCSILLKAIVVYEKQGVPYLSEVLNQPSHPLEERSALSKRTRS